MRCIVSYNYDLVLCVGITRKNTQERLRDVQHFNTRMMSVSAINFCLRVWKYRQREFFKVQISFFMTMLQFLSQDPEIILKLK